MYGSPIDFGFLPPNFAGDVQMFFSTATTSIQWQQWVKPRGISTVFMLAIGGGSGGGGGCSGAAGTQRGGGGGGASGGFCQALIPAVFLPDVLKILVGAGGVGGGPGATGVTGGSGGVSYIAVGTGLTQGTAIPNIVLESSLAGPTGGAGGATTGNAAAGSGASVSGAARIGGIGVWGIQKFTAGIGGSTGGATGNGTTLSAVWNTYPMTGGTGGGAATTAGFTSGPLNLVAAMDLPDGAFSPTTPHIAATAADTNGSDGIYKLKPFLMTGGMGGGSSNAATGGNGGNGGIGCGGGGGGGGVTGGTGGNGGGGLVVIISW